MPDYFQTSGSDSGKVILALRTIERWVGQDAEVLREAYLSNSLPPTQRDFTGYNVSYEVSLRNISVSWVAWMAVGLSCKPYFRATAAQRFACKAVPASQVLNVSDSTPAPTFTTGQPGNMPGQQAYLAKATKLLSL